MKRLVVSFLISVLAPVVAWMGGYDFDHRGFEAVMVSISACWIFVAAYSFPGWYL